MRGTAFAVLALAAVVTASCDNTVEPRRADAAAPPDRPSFSLGGAVEMKIVCPGVLVAGKHGYCWAYGVDTAGFYTGDYGGSFATTTPGLIAMTSSGEFVATNQGTAVITVDNGGVTGVLNLPISNGTWPAVSMMGQSVIEPNTNCTYVANASGGDTPYTYDWSVTGSASGSATDDTWVGSSPSSFTISVTVTDAVNRKVTANRNVFVIGGAGPCF